MKIKIHKASEQDIPMIMGLYRQIGSPHASSIDIREYFVATAMKEIIGCAAVRQVHQGGLLYGRAVKKEWRRQGIGTALVVERLQWLRKHGAKSAVGLVMFWNVSSFKKLGFCTVPRAKLDADYL